MLDQYDQTTVWEGHTQHDTAYNFMLTFSGFDAYVGFMHMENAHYNPVMLTFISILQMKINATKAKNLDEEQGNGAELLKNVSTCLKNI